MDYKMLHVFDVMSAYFKWFSMGENNAKSSIHANDSLKKKYT